MPRTIDAEQELLLTQPVTRPILLIEILVDGQEYLSTNGDVTIGPVTYLGADVDVQNIDDWRQARIRLQPTEARKRQFNAQSWRYGFCRIYLCPAVYYPQLVDPGYVDEGYAIEGVVYADPIQLVDGELTSGEASPDAVYFTVENRISAGRWLPGIRVSAPVFNHLPKPGETFTWEGDKYTLEAR